MILSNLCSHFLFIYNIVCPAGVLLFHTQLWMVNYFSVLQYVLIGVQLCMPVCESYCSALNGYLKYQCSVVIGVYVLWLYSDWCIRIMIVLWLVYTHYDCTLIGGLLNKTGLWLVGYYIMLWVVTTQKFSLTGFTAILRFAWWFLYHTRVCSDLWFI